MDVNLYKVHKVWLMNTFTKQRICYTKKNHCFHFRVIEIREDTKLSLSYEYTPLVVDLTTSTQVYDKTGKLVF